jgi:plastocyanin
MTARIAILALACLTLAATGCAAPERPGSAVGNDDGAAAPAPSASPASRGGAILTGVAPPAAAGFPSVVVLERSGTPDSAVPPLPDEPVVMDQIGLAFSPDILVIRAGRTVRFHNSEDVLHNIHVTDHGSGETVANVATPAPGSSHDLVLDKPGEYAVRCDVHPAMAAFVIVTSSPYFTIASGDGTFSLPAVPPGSYTLVVWSFDEAHRRRLPVEITAPETRIDVSEG